MSLKIKNKFIIVNDMPTKFDATNMNVLYIIIEQNLLTYMTNDSTVMILGIAWYN